MDLDTKGTGRDNMAYTDLISSQVTLIPGGATYNWAFDLMAATDGSPHVTHLGVQLNMTQAGGVNVLNSGFSNLIDALRVKVGSNIIMDYNVNAGNAPATIGQFGVMIQRLGGTDYATNTDLGALTTIGQISWPVGLDASRTHRVNVTLTLGNEAANMGNQPLVPGTSELNVVCDFGTSSESTIVGSRQDFLLTANSTRTITIYGKSGWNMLGVMTAGDVANLDSITDCRVNNGAFRELTATQWRGLNNAFSPTGTGNLQLGSQPDQAAGGIMSPKVFAAGQAGSIFFNLRRITAGANIDMAVTCEAIANHTVAFYPVWVAPIGRGTASPVRQTATTVQSTTATVEEASVN